MKKYLAILIILVLSLTLCPMAFAEQKEDVFYIEPFPELIKVINSTLKEREEFDKAYIERYHLKEGEVYDPSKVTHDTEHIFPRVYWKPEQFKELISSENVRDAIKDIEPIGYVYSCYYDGVLLPYREGYYKVPKRDGSIKLEFTNVGQLENGVVMVYTNKDELTEIISQRGIEDFDVLYCANVSALMFVVIEKEDTPYVVHLPTKYGRDHPNSTHAKMYDQQKELMEKDMMTVDEAIYLMDAYAELFSNHVNTGIADIESKVDNQTAEKPISKSNSSILIISISAGVVLLSVLGILIFKKAKGR